MRPEEVEELLDGMKNGTTTVEEALRALSRSPTENLGFARLDVHRELRQGIPEAIYAEGKSPEQVVAIAGRLLETTTGPVLATRVSPETASALRERFPASSHNELGRLVVLRSEERRLPGLVELVAAGTSDLPVAEEAAGVSEALGMTTGVIADVGVAGVHRVLELQDRLAGADVVIVVAGMEGALPSIVAGITPSPVVAVPTSVGYGAAFEGLAALLGMLNSCAAGVVVTNIDNGFGAAVFALRLLRAKRRR
jgi:pyridinium-3,5-biscarboxylic acid mononucleotide synthase